MTTHRVPVTFIISAPRSGSTMLARMLASHSQVAGGPEPHLITPLAHLGVWAKVDKAPYDHILAAEAQRLFVQRLPRGEQDYWEACRAYCDVLYGRVLEKSGKRIFLDKTPAYALVLPFLARVYPDASYVVLTRHPAAVFSSYANSFFDGDYQEAQAYNPILSRYVPAIADFLRQEEVPLVHVRYEDLVADPETETRRICDHIGIPFEPDMIEYGARTESKEEKKGLGDPIGVRRHVRPTSGSVKKWAAELAADTAKRVFMQDIVARLHPDDLACWGYPLEKFWQPLENITGKPVPVRRGRLTAYRLQRKLIVGLRRQARTRRVFRWLLEKIRLTCDVLLRE